MRKALNENPVVQVVLIGILIVVVGFLFMTRVASQGGSSAEEAPPAEPAATSTAPITGTVEPATGSPATSAAPTAPPATPGAPAPGTGEFVAGPGLPDAVVDAYERGETVVLLVVDRDGIDDRKVEAAVRQQVGGDAALFISDARDIAEYSRITQGVDVDRVPALVVIRPQRFAEGPLPEATVSYGYRGPQSIAQAVRDANYNGRSDLPTYPE